MTTAKRTPPIKNHVAERAAHSKNALRATPPPSGRLAKLSQREMTLAARAKERKRCALDLKVEEYESALTLAETFDEPLAVVLRACFRLGMEHYTQFASRADAAPFLDGALHPRARSEVDPGGLRRPTPQAPVFSPPPPPPNRLDIVAATRPATTTRIVEISEPVFSEANLPNGFTDDSRADIATPVEDDTGLLPVPAMPTSPAALIDQDEPPVIDAAAIAKAARAARVREKKEQLSRAQPIESEEESMFAPRPAAALGIGELLSQVTPNTTQPLNENLTGVKTDAESDDPNDFL